MLVSTVPSHKVGVDEAAPAQQEGIALKSPYLPIGSSTGLKFTVVSSTLYLA